MCVVCEGVCGVYVCVMCVKLGLCVIVSVCVVLWGECVCGVRVCVVCVV